LTRTGSGGRGYDQTYEEMLPALAPGLIKNSDRLKAETMKRTENAHHKKIPYELNIVPFVKHDNFLYVMIFAKAFSDVTV